MASPLAPLPTPNIKESQWPILRDGNADDGNADLTSMSSLVFLTFNLIFLPDIELRASEPLPPINWNGHVYFSIAFRIGRANCNVRNKPASKWCLNLEFCEKSTILKYTLLHRPKVNTLYWYTVNYYFNLTKVIFQFILVLYIPLIVALVLLYLCHTCVSSFSFCALLSVRWRAGKESNKLSTNIMNSPSMKYQYMATVPWTIM